MSERGHAAVEFAMAVGVLMLPVALVVMSFGPWLQTRVWAEAAAAEVARAVAIDLDHEVGRQVLLELSRAEGIAGDELRLGWCGATPGPADRPGGRCPLVRGSSVAVTVEVWTPLFNTPWGSVGGLWVVTDHSELLDLYRSFE